MYRNKIKAFTLIELLVVIAVIALLIAVLIPTLSIAKERARRVVCSKNVNQFIVAALIYADDYDSFLPPGISERSSPVRSHQGIIDEHTPVITRKIGNILIDILGDQETLKCPWLSDPFETGKMWYYPDYGYVLGYHYLGGHTATPWPVTEPDWVEWISPQKSSDAGSMELITELNAFEKNRRTFAPHGPRGPINKYHKPGTGGMSPQKAGAAGGNIGNLDGSVTWKNIEQMNTHRGSSQYQLNGCTAVW